MMIMIMMMMRRRRRRRRKRRRRKTITYTEERKGARQKVEKNHSDHDNHMKKRRGAIKVL